jgi:CubicO group peptidase (beta-lactamase class C family)
MQALPAVFCFVILFSAAAAQPVAITPEKRAQFEAVIARFMAANRIPGVSVAVVASRGRARFL